MTSLDDVNSFQCKKTFELRYKYALLIIYMG